MKRAGRKSLAQTPSPKEERIYGSKVNKEGSASSETEAKSISFSDKVMEILKKKQREYNKENPSTKVSIDVLKAVFRRGAGAYSRSHRPTITGGRPNSRTAWAIARVNKFLEKRSGKQVKKAYVQDDDLLKKYQSGGSTQPKDLTQIENYRNIYKGAEFYSFSDNPEKVEKADRWFELFRTNQKERQLTAGEFSEFMELSSELSWEEFSEGGRVVIGKPKVFYTRTYADGTKQEFSVEDYEKNVLPYHLGGDMSKHLAPNGKPSNLNHEQWHLVRTPEFKAWFGDWENDPANSSKVVDENGEPLVVYHGTPYEFTIFKKDKPTIGVYGQGFYFTNDKRFASNYAKTEGSKILSCFLNVKKIFDIDNDELPIGYEKYSDMADNKGKSRDFTIKLKSLFYDGVFAKNTYNENEIVVFYPEQIKLADGSNTTFDAENPDIRFAKGGMVEVVLNEGNGVAINKLYNEWANIRTEKQQIAWAKKVRETKFGSYGTIGILEVLDKFEFMQSNKVNGVMKHDFIEEVKDALNSYAEGGSVEQTPKFGAVENSKYKGWSEEKVMSYDFPELYEIAEKHHAGYKTIRKEFIKGIFVEREHTSDWGMSAHVSLQHVFENPQYYTILQQLNL